MIRTNRRRAAAVAPMLLLCAAWSAAWTGGGPATASHETSLSIPQLPDTPFDEPASVQPVAEPPESDTPAADLARSGIPPQALLAYQRAERLLAAADEECHLSWTVLAAIGRVESNHGRFGGNTLDRDGVATPGIYGIALDGTNGTARILDTDAGQLDRDTTHDRAVGPMQFIPGTWASVRVDADGDGERNPQDVDDAAAAAGVYLCAGPGDLSTDAALSKAIHRYNNSDDYVRLVKAIADRYAAGDGVEDLSNLAQGETRREVAADTEPEPSRRAARSKPKRTPSPEASDEESATRRPTPRPSPSPTPTPTATTPAPTPTPEPTPEPTPMPTPDPEPNPALTEDEAEEQCLLELPLGPADTLIECMTKFGFPDYVPSVTEAS